MKKFLLIPLILFLFFSASCVTVQSSANSDASPEIIIEFPEIAVPPVGNVSQPVQVQPQQDDLRPVVVSQPSASGKKEETRVSRGEGESSPAYLDMCITRWNSQGTWRWDNCYYEIAKSGRLNELIRPVSDVPEEIKTSSDPDEVKTGKGN
jgi:hypothetical protein